MQVFCDMTGASTGCGGGGWTLVMRMDGHTGMDMSNLQIQYLFSSLLVGAFQWPITSSIMLTHTV